MQSARRESAVLAANMVGAQARAGDLPGSGASNRFQRRLLRDKIEMSGLPYLLIDPRPGLHILEANRAYADATMIDPRRVCGDRMFDVFPDNPDVADADGVSNLYESLRKAAQTGTAHKMPIQRYDTRDAAGCFVERHWLPVNQPIFDDAGRLIFLLHHAIDVTETVLAQKRAASSLPWVG